MDNIFRNIESKIGRRNISNTTVLSNSRTNFFYITAGKDMIKDEELCKICMDNPVDCVMLECGHMCTCTRCGKQMAECPICRQYVVRVVRTFKA